MKSLPVNRAQSLAHELTCEVSTHLSGSKAARKLLHCFPPETWNLLTVGLPWEAFGIAHSGIGGSKPEPPKIPSADQRGLSRARSMG